MEVVDDPTVLAGPARGSGICQRRPLLILGDPDCPDGLHTVDRVRRSEPTTPQLTLKFKPASKIPEPWIGDKEPQSGVPWERETAFGAHSLKVEEVVKSALPLGGDLLHSLECHANVAEDGDPLRGEGPLGDGDVLPLDPGRQLRGAAPGVGNRAVAL